MQHAPTDFKEILHGFALSQAESEFPQAVAPDRGVWKVATDDGPFLLKGRYSWTAASTRESLGAQRDLHRNGAAVPQPRETVRDDLVYRSLSYDAIWTMEAWIDCVDLLQPNQGLTTFNSELGQNLARLHKVSLHRPSSANRDVPAVRIDMAEIHRLQGAQRSETFRQIPFMRKVIAADKAGGRWVAQCHGDLHSGNVLRSKATGGLTFIDFNETSVNRLYTDVWSAEQLFFTDNVVPIDDDEDGFNYRTSAGMREIEELHQGYLGEMNGALVDLSVLAYSFHHQRVKNLTEALRLGMATSEPEIFAGLLSNVADSAKAADRIMGTLASPELSLSK